MTTNISAAAATLGKKGGQSTSKAKQEAARANGRKGGRQSNKMVALLDHLKSGGQITNGPQSISYGLSRQTGYLACDDPNCCDATFEGLKEVKDFITLAGDWEIVPK